MHMMLAAVAAIGAAAFAFVAWLRNYRCVRSQRRWELRWQRFLGSQSALDRELDRLWHLLERLLLRLLERYACGLGGL